MKFVNEKNSGQAIAVLLGFISGLAAGALLGPKARRKVDLQAKTVRSDIVVIPVSFDLEFADETGSLAPSDVDNVARISDNQIRLQFGFEVATPGTGNADFALVFQRMDTPGNWTSVDTAHYSIDSVQQTNGDPVTATLTINPSFPSSPPVPVRVRIRMQRSIAICRSSLVTRFRVVNGKPKPLRG